MAQQTSDMICVYPAMLARIPFIPVSQPKGESITYEDENASVTVRSSVDAWPSGKNPRYFIMAICHALHYGDRCVVVNKDDRTIRFECSLRGVYRRMGVQDSIHGSGVLEEILERLSSMEITVESKDVKGIPGYIRTTKATSILDPDGTAWVGDGRCACAVKLTPWAWEQFNDRPVCAYRDEVKKLGNSARAMDVYMWTRSYAQRGCGLRCTMDKMRDIMGGELSLRVFRNVIVPAVKQVNNASASFCLTLGRKAILGRILKNPSHDRPDATTENQECMFAPECIQLPLPYGRNHALSVVAEHKGVPSFVFLNQCVNDAVEKEVSALLGRMYPRPRKAAPLRLDKAMTASDALHSHHRHTPQCPYVVACVNRQYGTLLSRGQGINGESFFDKACEYFIEALHRGMDEDDALLFAGARMLEYGARHTSELAKVRSQVASVPVAGVPVHVHSADCSHVRAVGERVFGDVLFESGGAAVFDGLCGRLAGLWNEVGDGADAAALAEEVLANFEG